MIPLNIIIDGNYLFHRTLFIAMGFTNRNGIYLEKESEQNQFIRKIATDFSYDVNLFKGCNKVIFTKDSRSWRKEYSAEYKSNRKYDKNIVNWNIFYQLMDEFIEIISKQGIITSSIEKAEGDDLIYLWSNYFLENKESSVIITADKDLTQLVNYDDKNFIVVYSNKSKNKKIVTKTGFIDWIKDKETKPINIFNMEDAQIIADDANILLKKILNSDIEIEEIDPAGVLLEKIICGDKSDNVSSIWTWKNKNGNTNKATKTYFNKIYNTLIEKYYKIDIGEITTNQALINRIKQIISSTSKQNISSKEFTENLIRNWKLTCLNNETIPSEIQENFYSSLKSKNINTKCPSFNRIELLKGTKFEKKISVVSNIFDDEPVDDFQKILKKSKK